MTLAVEIQEVRTAEEFGLREVFRSYRDGLPRHLQFPDAEWRELPGAYARPGGALLHAKVARQSAGCVGLRPLPCEGVCEIRRLFVRPTFRSHKLGDALLVRILDVARELGYRQVRLDTYLATGGAAVQLYRRLRFAEVPPDPCRSQKDCHTWS